MHRKRYVITATALAGALLLLIFVTKTADDPERGHGTRIGEVDTPPAPITNTASGESVAIESAQSPARETAALADDPGFSCPEPGDADELDFAAMAAALEYSDDPEHLLMASLYGGERRRPEPSPFPEQRNLEGLFKGLQIEPRNELLLWNALTLCAESGETDRCDEHRVPELATTVLGNNATFWFRLAAIRADAGDMEGAFAALQRSLAAPEYNEYFIEHVELFARGISAYNNAPYNERVVAGFGLAAALPSPESDLLLACQQQAPTSLQWLNTCIALGERMEARGRTLLSVMLGLGLQKAMFEISGDNLRAQAAEARAASRRRFIDDLSEQDNENIVLAHDERVLEAFVDTWKASGEFEALQYVQRETRRLMNTPGYQPCVAR